MDSKPILPAGMAGAAARIIGNQETVRDGKAAYGEICTILNRLPTGDQRIHILLLCLTAQMARYQFVQNLNRGQRHRYYKKTAEFFAGFFSKHLLDQKGPLDDGQMPDEEGNADPHPPCRAA